MTARDFLALARAALISAMMFISGALVPIVGALAVVFAPAPIMGCAVGFRNTLWRAAALTAAAAGLVALAGGRAGAAGYFSTVGISAILLCLMLERRRPFEQIIAAVAAGVVATSALCAIAFIGSPQALAQTLHHDLLQVMGRTEKFYAAAGLESVMTKDLRIRIVDATIQLMPALAVMSGAAMALANLALFWRLSGRQQRVGYALFGDLVRWATPEWLIWVLLVTGFGLFIPLAPMRTAALNCFVCVATVYFCQGLAIMAFYFRVLAMPSLARGLIFAITMIQPVLAILVCLAGVLDLWIDFRRLKPSRPETHKASHLV